MCHIHIRIGEFMFIGKVCLYIHTFLKPISSTLSLAARQVKASNRDIFSVVVVMRYIKYFMVIWLQLKIKTFPMRVYTHI